VKRFYKDVGIESEPDGSFCVRLDGKPVRTPGQALLAVPNAALAEAIAAEWRAQGEKVDPAAMPLTRLANSVIDGIAGRESAVAEDILNYARSDLLCYRAGSPEGLVAAQAKHWDPILAWAKQDLGAPFLATIGMMPVAQPEASLGAIEKQVSSLDKWRLGALHVMTALLGSALLPLAILKGRLPADAAWAAGHVDEDWQIKQWGEDHEAKGRRKLRLRDYNAAAKMLELLNGE
jgi:chaperone required for assembly of F1-ATPase